MLFLRFFWSYKRKFVTNFYTQKKKNQLYLALLVRLHWISVIISFFQAYIVPNQICCELVFKIRFFFNSCHQKMPLFFKLYVCILHLYSYKGFLRMWSFILRSIIWFHCVSGEKHIKSYRHEWWEKGGLYLLSIYSERNIFVIDILIPREWKLQKVYLCFLDSWLKCYAFLMNLRCCMSSINNWRSRDRWKDRYNSKSLGI